MVNAIFPLTSFAWKELWPTELEKTEKTQKKGLAPQQGTNNLDR